MHRTTVYLDDDTVLAIRQLATREQRSQAEIIRDALKQYFESSVQQPERPGIIGVGSYRSGRSDVSANAETILRRAARKRG